MNVIRGLVTRSARINAKGFSRTSFSRTIRMATAAPLLVLLAGATYSQTADAQNAPHVAGRYMDKRGRMLQDLCPAETSAAGSRRCFAHRVLGPNSAPTPMESPDVTCTPAKGTSTTPFTGSMTAMDLQKIYGLTNAAPSGGQVVAIVDAYGYANALTEMNIYRKAFGIPELAKCTGTVPKVGDPACFSNIDEFGFTSKVAADPTGGWEGEAALDLDMVSAACPDCSIVLVSAKTPTDAHLQAAVAIGPKKIPGLAAVSNSYGGTESQGDDDTAYTQKGVLILAASGDQDYLNQGTQNPALRTSPRRRRTFSPSAARSPRLRRPRRMASRKRCGTLASSK